MSATPQNATTGLPALRGHHEVRTALARALSRSRLPRALLLHGAAGIGKQRLAHWIGQLLLCTSPGAEGPCGSCRDCRLAKRVEHPEIHWYVPLPRPKTRGSREREDEALEDARVDWVTEARASPYRPSHHSELRAIQLGTIRNFRKRVRKGAGPRGRQLFLLADAEELVAQEASQEAANALLKTLEEPPADTWIVLTSSEPGRLLDTIRSRTTPIHLTGLDESTLREILVTELDADPEAAGRAARLSGGALGRALGLLPVDGEPGPLEVIRQDAFHLMRAALESSPGPRFERALQYPVSGARTLGDLLSALEVWLRDLGAVLAENDEAILNRDAVPWLEKRASLLPLDPAGPSRAVARVQEAREQAAGNVNPQLVLTGLMAGLARVLVREPG